MTRPLARPEARAAAIRAAEDARWNKARALLGLDGPADTSWNEGMEQRMSFVAETFDHETGRSRPLRRRKP